MKKSNQSGVATTHKPSVSSLAPTARLGCKAGASTWSGMRNGLGRVLIVSLTQIDHAGDARRSPWGPPAGVKKPGRIGRRSGRPGGDVAADTGGCSAGATSPRRERSWVRRARPRSRSRRRLPRRHRRHRDGREKKSARKRGRRAESGGVDDGVASRAPLEVRLAGRWATRPRTLPRNPQAIARGVSGGATRDAEGLRKGRAPQSRGRIA